MDIKGSRVKATATPVAKVPNMRKGQDGFYPDRTSEPDIDRALASYRKWLHLGLGGLCKGWEVRLSVGPPYCLMA